MKILVTIVLALYFVSDCVTSLNIGNYKARYKKLEIAAEVSDIEDVNYVNNKIINGDNASNGQFPYSVRISFYHRSNRINLCSGSIISKSFVLSAGHCIDSLNPDISQVRMDMGTSNVDNNQITITASEYFWLDMSKNPALNIAIYRTSTEINFNGLIQPIRLPSRRQRNEEFVGSPAEIMGWGNTVADNKLLFYGNFRILANAACINQIQSFYEMCTLPQEINLQAQPGDSGAPLVIIENGIPTQIGIYVRLRSRNGMHFHIATRVSLFLDYIYAITNIPIRD